MTDKEKIRKFLEGMANADCCVTQVAKVINKIILPYIDSLQEEPVSEDLEEEWKRYITSEEYLNDIPGGLPVARHFANWQKRQDDKILNEKQWEAWAKGGEEMKQELMKEADIKNGDSLCTALKAEIERRIRNLSEKACEASKDNHRLSSQYSALIVEYGDFLSYIISLQEEKIGKAD